MKKLIIIFLILISGGAFFGAKGASLFQAQSTENAPRLEPQIAVDPSTEETEEAVVIAPPQTLIIPKINVESVVESAGIDSEKKPILPKDSDNVVWYDLGAKPGEKGSAVISGHWDKESGAPAVFYDLKKLEVGDEIIVEDQDSKKYTFEVTKKIDYPYDKVPLQEIYAGQTDVPLLNLITCGGAWNSSTKLYSHRTVIYSKLVN